MKKRVYLIIAIIMVVFLSKVKIENHVSGNSDILSSYDKIDHYVFDNNSGTIKTMDELVKEFKKNSPNYKKIGVRYQTESLNYDLYSEQINAINKEVNECIEFIKEYKISKDIAIENGDLDTAESFTIYINQYENQLFNLRNSQEELELKGNLYKFYKDNQEELIKQDEKKLEMDFKKSCLSIITYNEEIEQYKLTQKYIKSLINIENKKLKKGHTTRTAVNELEVQLSNINIEIQRLIKQREQVLNDLKIETGLNENFNIKYNFNITNKSYHKDSIFTLLMNKDFTNKELNDSLKVYQKHKENLINRSGESSLTIKQLDLKIKDIKYDIVISDHMIKSTANESVEEYNYLIRLINVKKENVDLLNKQYLELSKQYEKGKIAKIELEKLDIERKEMISEYYQTFIDYILLEERLSTGIL